MTNFNIVYEINKIIENYYRNNIPSGKGEVIDEIIKEIPIFKIKRSLYSNINTEYIFRFLWSKFDEGTPSNTFLSISNIYDFDHLPIVVILIRPNSYTISLGNTTFVKKVSHSSKGSTFNVELEEFNLVGSVNYSNLVIENNTLDFIEDNWEYHTTQDSDDNIYRILQLTSEIEGYGKERLILDNDSIDRFIRHTINIHSNLYNEIYTTVQSSFNKHYDEVNYLFNTESTTKVRGEKIQSLITGVTDNDHEFADMYYEINNKSILINIKTIDLTMNSEQSSPQAFNIDKLINNIDYDDEFAFYFFIIIKHNNGLDFVLINFLDTIMIPYYGNPMNQWSGVGTRGHIQISSISQLLDIDNFGIIEKESSTEFIRYLNEL